MASPDTTPMPTTETKPRIVSLRFLFLFAGVLLAVVAAVLVVRSQIDPFRQRLIGVWTLRTAAQYGPAGRVIEFRDDGYFRISWKEKGKTNSTEAGWRVSGGDLMIALTDPDPFAKNASLGSRLKDAAQIVEDRLNDRYSDRYTVVDDGGNTIKFLPHSKKVATPFTLQRIEKPSR